MAVLNKIDLNIFFKAIDQSLATIVFDPDGNILHVNRNFSNVIGYEVEEMPGMHHRELCLQEFYESDDYLNFWRDLRKGKAFHDKVQRVRKNGNILWLDAMYTPVINDEGIVEAVIKFATDITEQELALHNSANEFTAVVEMMTESTNKVHEASLTTVSDMDILNQEAETVKNNIEQIQTVAFFVKEIAAKSKILGLNASIEAARAGEHGRGFAIVANEVQKLADTSEQSADNITEQLSGILESVTKMVEQVVDVTEKVGSNKNSIEELKQAYTQIAVTAEKLTTII